MKEMKTGSISNSRKWNFLLFLRKWRNKTNEILFLRNSWEYLSFRILSRVRWIRKMGREDVRMKEFSSMCVWNTIQHRWPARPAPSCICVDDVVWKDEVILSQEWAMSRRKRARLLSRRTSSRRRDVQTGSGEWIVLRRVSRLNCWRETFLSNALTVPYRNECKRKNTLAFRSIYKKTTFNRLFQNIHRICGQNEIFEIRE